MDTTLIISGIVEESIVDGPGLRFVIFSQGCIHNCEGCHNPETHSMRGGYQITIGELLDKIKSNPLLQGVTFSGGDPFEQASGFAKLGKAIRELGLNIYTYTGYTHETIVTSGNSEWMKLLDVTHYLVDGPYDKNKKTLNSKFIGSYNQRIIDMRRGIAL